MATKLKSDKRALVGNAVLNPKAKCSRVQSATSAACHLVKDILSELAKPGRDPRSEFRVVKFDDKVHSMEDLKPGMVLEGVITNVTHFGAFIDIGVHQDALIHIFPTRQRLRQRPQRNCGRR